MANPKINSKDIIYNLGKKGSVDRTLHDKLKEMVSVKDFGAKGDGNQDDSDAIQNAVNSFNENSFMSVQGDGKLYFPKGRYKITKNIISKKAINYQGDGVEISQIYSYSGASFVHDSKFVGSNEDANQFSMNDIRIYVAENHPGSVLSLSFIDGAAISDVNIRNVEILGAHVSISIKNAMKLYNSRIVRLEQCKFVGDQDKLQSWDDIQSDRALLILGDKNPCEIYLSDCFFMFWKTAIYVGGNAEGVNIRDMAILAVRNGIVYNSNWSSSGSRNIHAEPWLSIFGSHINASRYCVHLTNVIQFNIGNNHIYGQNYSNTAEKEFNAITVANDLPKEFWGAYHIKGNIHDNYISLIPQHLTPESANGVVIKTGIATESTLIHGNQYQNLNRGIWLQENTQECVVGPVQLFTACKNPIVNQGTNNKILFK
jgi:hypothetical protein|tara:strand:+ start:4312 stop:5595 length:1284 start_codon:yes stop_codon:yes gene_type:complete